jgi:hypothetical protein
MAKICALEDEQAYEAELSQCVGVTGYHHWFFLSALANALNCDFQAFAVDSGAERRGVIPLFFQRRGPVSTANYIPFGYIGPVIHGEALRAGRMGELLRGIRPVLRRHRTFAARWAFAPGLKLDPAALAAQGFSVATWKNYVIPGTKSVDDFLKSLPPARRRAFSQALRRAQDQGTAVHQASLDEIVQWLPGQVDAISERQGIAPVYPSGLVRSMAERLASHPRLLWRAVKNADGAVLGIVASVIGDDRLWGWLLAGPPVEGISVQTLCYWDSITWSLSRGLAVDLGGARTEGIEKFKVSLRPETETMVLASQYQPQAAYNLAAALRRWGPVQAGLDRVGRLIEG